MTKEITIKELAAIFAAIDDAQQMERFLSEVLTDTERHDLALRWELMKRLKQGMSQREIAAELGISLCKITRGARILKNAKTVSAKLLKDEE